MKDAKGHGSAGRGSYHNIDKNLNGPGRHVGYANGSWRIEKSGSAYRATHRDSGDTFSGNTLGAISQGLSDRAAGMAYQRSGAADALAGGGAKSDAAPIHDSMTASRVNEAEGAMSRLKTTFRQGDNRHGEYGKNVREAHDRHAKVWSGLTGRKPPSIYD